MRCRIAKMLRRVADRIAPVAIAVQIDGAEIAKALEERNFLLRRQGLGHSQSVGVSSDALLAAACTGTAPTARPLDEWDLARCIVTMRTAPDHLRHRMQQIVGDWIGMFESREPGSGDRAIVIADREMRS